MEFGLKVTRCGWHLKCAAYNGKYASTVFQTAKNSRTFIITEKNNESAVKELQAIFAVNV